MATTLDLMEWPDNAAAQAAYVASDGDVVKENFETGADDAMGIGDIAGTDYWSATKIVVGAEIPCSGVSIYIEGTTGTIIGDLTFRLETDDAGEPSGVLAHANATYALANASITNDAWNKAPFVRFTLPADTYWLVMSVPAQANNNYLAWKVDANGGTNTRGYTSDLGVNWTVDNFAPYFRLFDIHFQCYSEDTIKEQGSYSLKGIAKITDSLNDTLTRTVSPTIDLSSHSVAQFGIYAGRTGSNIKLGIHDSGGTTTEITPSITSAGAWQTVNWDLSGVSDANKDVIDSIIITIVNADSDNTFYIDNFFGLPLLTIDVHDCSDLKEKIGG